MKAAAVAVLLSTAALADEPKDFAGWEDAYAFDCNGPYRSLSGAEVVRSGGFEIELFGGTAKLRRDKPRSGPARLGLLAGIKDLDPETQALLQTFLAAFEKADVDLIVIGGDTAEEPDVLDKVYAFLSAATKRPLITVTGNTERSSAHNASVLKVRRAGNPHLLNASLIRRFDGEGFDVVTLAGYHDKRYLHLTGGCLYPDKAIDEVADAAKDSNDPVVFLAHGPPKQSGKAALDFVPGAGNVGDPRLTELVSRAKIPFGIFGHILEAAGHGTDLKGAVLPPKKLHPQLFVNQGSANPLPWKLNDGTTSYGLAAILTIDGKKASYEMLRAPKPKPVTE